MPGLKQPKTYLPSSEASSLTAMPAPQASLGSLISRTIANGQQMVKSQITLAQAELKVTAQSAGKVGIFAVAAIGSITLFTIFLLITLAYVLVELGLPVWAGFGIVSAVLLLLAIIMALLAKSQASKMNGPKIIVDEFEQTKRELEQTLGLPPASNQT
jgi:hypothetical protein